MRSGYRSLYTVFWPDRYFQRTRLKQLQLANAARRSEVTRTPISRVQPASSFIPAIRDLNYLFGSYLFIRLTCKRMARRKFSVQRSILHKENETKNPAFTFKMHRILPFSCCEGCEARSAEVQR